MTAQLDSREQPPLRPRSVPALRENSLLRNAAMLVISSGSMALMSFVFWTIAARRYTVEQVGVATTLVSALTLLTYLSLFGLSTSLIVYLPGAKNRAEQISAALSITAIGGVVFSVGYLVLLPIVAARASAGFHSPLAIAVFVAAVVAGSVNLATDSVFIAMRSAHWNVVVDGAVQGVAKLAPIVLLAGGGAFGLFGAFTAGSVAAALSSLILIRRKLHLRLRPVRDVRSALSGYLSYSSTSYVSSLFNLAPLLVVPIVVLDVQGSRAAGAYYVAFQFAILLYSVAFAICESLFAEASHHPSDVSALGRRASGYLVAALLPGALVVAALAHPVLEVFGHDYANDGTGLLRILCLGAAPMVVNTLSSFLLKIRLQMGWLVASNVVYFFVAAGLPLLFRHGLAAVGWSWFAANAASGAIAVVGLLRRPDTEAKRTPAERPWAGRPRLARHRAEG